MATTVVNRKQIRELGPNDVYIGRPSIWGNSFSHRPSKFKGTIIVETVELAIEYYETCMRDRLNHDPALRHQLLALDGKRLVCWCKPGPCHGDVLVKLIKEMAMPRHVAIVGSRDYPRLDVVHAFILKSLRPDDIVVSGGARGVDSSAATAARERGLEVVEYIPDWSKGRGAGMERNSVIVADCDALVAFWDGSSRGTMDSVRKAIAAGKRVWVIDSEGKIIQRHNEQ